MNTENETYASSAARLGSGASATQLPKQTTADHIRDNAERAVHRLCSLRSRLDDLRGRITGEYSGRDGDAAKEVLASSGFVPGVSTAVERIHAEINNIEDVLTSLSDVI